MERRLSEFFTQKTAERAGFTERNTDSDPVITGLEYDSRKVKNGNLFFALSGLHTDGSLYIDDALARGAAAIIYEKETVKVNPKAVFIKVKNSRFAMSPVSAAFYDHPSRRMLVTGVTGTEGKSTTVYLIWQLLVLLGKKAGFFSTVQSCTGQDVQRNSEHQTTPEAPEVQRLLWEMAANGCEYAVVEASSHGLSKKTNRLGDVNFCSAVFTNVTHEHLEFHGTWEQYRDDKANLFRALDGFTPPVKFPAFKPFGVINADDKSCRFFAKSAKCKTFKFSAAGIEADIALEAVESSAWGNWYRAFIKADNDHIDFRDKLPGAFNIGNVFASVLAVSGLLGLHVREAAPFVNRLKPVRGRMTTIDKGQPFEIVVDYAHTPSSFRAIFPPLRFRLKKTGGRIISLFGSPGERDTQKRAEQGKIAATYSDIIVITDEDPRGEDPMAIIEEIASGCEAAWSNPPQNAPHHPASHSAESHPAENHSGEDVFRRGENLFLIPNRPQAIRKAFSLANAGDLVLLLGKGHENSIIYADHVMPYDEITEAEIALDEMHG
jgi:UDP-N-acetylmuramoyl-L-alanyl-D-glutamate--2,6-diaminopimelate ligase